MNGAEFTVGVMNDSEVRLAVDWAAEESWNPGPVGLSRVFGITSFEFG